VLTAGDHVNGLDASVSCVSAQQVRKCRQELPERLILWPCAAMRSMPVSRKSDQFLISLARSLDRVGAAGLQVLSD
jgi:hypothetical protein